MNSKIVYSLLGAVAVLLLLTVVVSHREDKQVEDTQRGKIFLTDLDAKINDVARIEIVQGNQTTNLFKKDNVWVLKERNEYPADVSQIKQLVLSLAQLKTIEQKTSSKENYEKLGVQEVSPSTTNKKITLSDASGASMISLIVGNGKGNGSYVRKSNDAQAWLVEGTLMFPGVVNGWLDKTILEITASEIQKVSIRNHKNEHIELARLKKEDMDLSVVSPKLKGTADAVAISNIAGALSRLQFDDVLPRDQIFSPTTKASTVQYTVSTQMKIDIRVTEKDKKFYLALDFSPIANSAATETSPTSDQKTYDPAALHAKYSTWAFEVPAFKAESFRKTLNELTQVAVNSSGKK